LRLVIPLTHFGENHPLACWWEKHPPFGSCCRHICPLRLKLFAAALFTKSAGRLDGKLVAFVAIYDFIKNFTNEVDRSAETNHRKKVENLGHMTSLPSAGTGLLLPRKGFTRR